MPRGPRNRSASPATYSGETRRLKKARTAAGEDRCQMLGQDCAGLPCVGHSRYSAAQIAVLHTRMLPMGQKQTSAHVRVMSALPPKADILRCSKELRYS